MKKTIPKAQITLDTFVKRQAREFFGSCGYLKAAGADMKFITKATGLSEAEIKKL